MKKVLVKLPIIKRKFLCHVVAFFVAFFVVAPIAQMAMDRTPPYTAIRGEISPDNPKPGDLISVHWVGVNKKECTGTVNRTITDSAGVIHAYATVDSVYANLEKGAILSREFQLPVSISSGPAVYRAYNKFICNPIHWFWPIPATTPDIKFNIATK